MHHDAFSKPHESEPPSVPHTISRATEKPPGSLTLSLKLVSNMSKDLSTYKYLVFDVYATLVVSSLR
jgi:hypothetical protein